MNQIERHRLATALRWRAALLQSLVVLHIAVTVLAVSYTLWTLTAHLSPLIDALVGAFSVGFVIGLGTTTLVLLAAPLWVWRAHATLRALALPGLVYPPLLTAVSWFVPLVGLIVPPCAMRELFNRSAGKEAYQARANVPAIKHWWSCLIGGVVLQAIFVDNAHIVVVPFAPVVRSPPLLAIIGALGTVLLLASFGFLFGIVRRITLSQQMLVMASGVQT